LDYSASSSGGGSITLQPDTGTSPVGSTFIVTGLNGIVTNGDSGSDTLEVGIDTAASIICSDVQVDTVYADELTEKTSGAGTRVITPLCFQENTTPASPGVTTHFMWMTSSGIFTKNSAGTVSQYLKAASVSGVATLNDSQFWCGNSSNVATARTMSGDGTLDNTGRLTIAALATLDNKELHADLTLTNAQVLSLNSTPITVVAAPGAGFAILLLRATATFTWTAAYATNTTLNIVPAGFTGQTQATFGTFLASTATAHRAASSGGSPVLNDNVALQAFVSTGNPTAGNAANTIKIRVYYTVVAVPVF
jgi:hypothetical protein